MAKLKDTLISGNLQIDGSITGNVKINGTLLPEKGILPTGTNTFDLTSDTTANWGSVGLSTHFYNTTGLLTDQPAQNGFLLNIGNGGTEVHQLWMTQAGGNLLHRGGNWQGWKHSWRTLLDSGNFREWVAPVKGGFFANSESILTSSSDLNNCTNPGIMYRWDTGNRPANSPAAGCSMFWVATGWGGTQFCFHYGKDGTIWIRNIFVGEWGSWRVLVQ